ncbi:hypothetical protein AGABI2DRAFT_201067 [Agaricus bisporus var. bisporus H97]|uniref:hypothetical protein n=1 Tax=Agaricus bisporus var. bisporus (strain H97 / ATCC MYA-4626 / FGSC 10389) TaxID=936046 RepID=UPI00029F7D7D|nr:hypothetical protein AGABI2DRAFT_201067 [Agaricus bisporus var. bisporus H97]EKV49023.1 hypothetical protein AGABI2DRAFT_201067 [Agaricus bisporus var. bisporus H97]
MVGERRPIAELPVDPSFLQLEESEKKFFKLWTGIDNEEELREHIIDITARAYKASDYPCIAGFTFTKSKIARVPVYDHILQLARERPGAILLDIGCCFGQDLRKAVTDGWPEENAIGSDLEPAFWEYGHQLFKTNPESFKAGFVAGDAFDPKMIKPQDPFCEPPTTPRPNDLRLLESLTPLQGHVSVIHASSLFHLFDEDGQIILAKRLASLLSPEPGSVICGRHRGTPVKTATSDLMDFLMVCHSPESWKELWDGQIFEKGKVRVDAVVSDDARSDLLRGRISMLNWSITRL